MVVLLALLAALLFALAAAAEQRAAARLVRPPAAARCCAAARCPKASRSPASRVDLAGHKVRRWAYLAIGLVLSPLWIAGWVADALGFAAQASALHFGSLSVVQPLLVTTLLFSLPLAVVGTRRRPRWTDWTGAVAVCVGLALVLTGRHVGSSTPVYEGRLFTAILLSLAVVGVLVLSAVSGRARGRATALSVAAGMMFSLGAVFTKLVTDRFADGGFTGAISYWPAYALVVVSLLGLVLQQGAFSVGSLPATMTAITITDPLLSYILGVVGFGEPAPRGATAMLTVFGLGLLAAGVVVLARSPLLQAPSRPQPVPSSSPSHPALSSADAVYTVVADGHPVGDGAARALAFTSAAGGARDHHPPGPGSERRPLAPHLSNPSAGTSHLSAGTSPRSQAR